MNPGGGGGGGGGTLIRKGLRDVNLKFGLTYGITMESNIFSCQGLV